MVYAESVLDKLEVTANVKMSDVTSFLKVRSASDPLKGGVGPRYPAFISMSVFVGNY